ncbi:hypothetical protein STFR1_70152 [Bacillus vallismortis]
MPPPIVRIVKEMPDDHFRHRVRSKKEKMNIVSKCVHRMQLIPLEHAAMACWSEKSALGLT